ncbi:MAG: hypothetical protein QG632_847 [Candidatus Dependentiae bacterium]|nr:hypothetical protein [Candidatus Dependentiae bacterium]MDQ5951007.1 hypothetical protein [Patescibacteria group bacterium]
MMNNLRVAATIMLAACFAVVLFVFGAAAVTLAAPAQIAAFYNVCIKDSEDMNVVGWPFTGTSQTGGIVSGTMLEESCAGGTFEPGVWTFDAGTAVAVSPQTIDVPGGSVQRWDFVFDPDPSLFGVLTVQVIDDYENPAPTTLVTVTSVSGAMFTGRTMAGAYTVTVRKGEATVQVAEQITTVSVLSDTAVITIQETYESPGEEWLVVEYRGYDEEGNQFVAPYVDPEVLSPQGWDCIVEYPGGEVPCADSIEDAPEITLPATAQVQSLQSMTQVFQLRATRPELSAQQVIVISKAVEVPSEPWMQFSPGSEGEQSKDFRFWLDPSVYNTLETSCRFVSKEMALNLVVSPCPTSSHDAVVIPVFRGYAYVIQVTVTQRNNTIKFPVAVPEVPGEGPGPFTYFVFAPLLER